MNISSLSAAATQELLETAAQTKAEANKGDQQAIRRMAKTSSQTQVQLPTPQAEVTPAAEPSSTGVNLDVKV